jgi:hypothetical protein
VDAACDSAIQIIDRVTPRARYVTEYGQVYPIYRGLYATLKPTFDTLTSLVL